MYTKIIKSLKYYNSIVNNLSIKSSKNQLDNLIASSGHLPLAKTLWKQVIKPGDIIIDATCGNGKDSLDLAELLFNNLEHLTIKSDTIAKLYCIDIQTEAITETYNLLSNSMFNQLLTNKNIELINDSHESFPNYIVNHSVSLIVYNLGYLPRGNRGDSYNNGQGPKTTSTTTTKSIINALQLIKPGGLITVTSYRGHEGGIDEYKAIENLLITLDPLVWRIYSHNPLNRPIAPVLFSIYKNRKAS